MDNPMWGADIDDDNPLQNLILPSSSVSAWSPTPNAQSLSNDEISSPFSEFFLSSRNFHGENADDSLNSIFATENLANVQNKCDNANGNFSRLAAPSTSSTGHSIFCDVPENHAISLINSANSQILQNQTSSTINDQQQIKEIVGKNGGKKKKMPKTPLNCHICSFSSTSHHKLMVHKRSTHFGVKKFSCADCAATFTRSYSLKRHVLQKHHVTFIASPQLPRYCPFPGCNYVTRSTQSMQIHKRSHHQKVVSYFCKRCTYCTYSRREHLLKHLTQFHSGDVSLLGIANNNYQQQRAVTSVQLNVEPDLEEVEKNQANVLILEHNEDGRSSYEKVYNCDKCEFTSKNFLDVYRHKQSVQHSVGENDQRLSNKNVCLYCHKKFSSTNGLLTHIKKLHLDSRQQTKKMYRCPKCDFTTRRKKVLTSHEENTHFVAHSNSIRYTIGTPMGRSPPTKSDRNSVNSENAFANFGTCSTGSQNFVQSADLQSTPESCCRLPNYAVATATAIAIPNNTNSANCNNNNFPMNNGVHHVIPLANNINGNPIVAANPISAVDTFDEIAFSMQHIQQANIHLLNLCRRRDNELNSLRTNVLELLKRFYVNDLNFFDQTNSSSGNVTCFSLENVDQLVVKAINDNIFR